MTQEDKQLLLRDLCARLAFGRVKCQVKVESFNEEMDDYIEFFDDEIVFIEPRIYNVYLYEEGTDVDISDIKPYLRPISSMTEEEKQLVRWFKSDIKTQGAINLYMNRYVEWLDSRHFDWRTDGNGKTLIEKGLAIKAPEGMYKNE